MDETLREYAEYLEKEKKMAENTRLAYQSDVTELQTFLAQRGNDQPLTAGNADVVAWMLKLIELGKKNGLPHPEREPFVRTNFIR